jgi:putative ubiquitin-RnfH superfamily antitoxin RatB of RatAB toxin-antitoxin module
MKVEVAWVGQGVELCVCVDLEPGARVADALACSGLLERIPDSPDTPVYAIFGRKAGLDAELSDGDRVEITRPLACDPKLARIRATAHRRRASRA